MKEKKKNWFRRHPIWSGIISIIIVLFVIFIAFPSDNSSTKGVNTQQPQEQADIRAYVDEDIYELWILFISRDSPYTDLQKEENFKQYKNKWIKSSGVVSEIDDGLFGSIIVSIESPDNPYLRAATLYFDDFYKDELLNYRIYDEINFEGRIESYNGLVGVIVKDVELR